MGGTPGKFSFDEWKPVDLLFVLVVPLFFSLFFAWAYSAGMGYPTIFDHLPIWMPGLIHSKPILGLLGSGGLLAGTGMLALRKWFLEKSLPRQASPLMLLLTVSLSGILILAPRFSRNRAEAMSLEALPRIANFNLEIDEDHGHSSALQTHSADYWIVKRLPEPQENPQPLDKDQEKAGRYTYRKELVGSGYIDDYIGKVVSIPRKEADVRAEFSILGSYSLSGGSTGAQAEIDLKCASGECEALGCQNITFEGCGAKPSTVASLLSWLDPSVRVFAATNANQGRGPGWVVPSLKTLEGMSPEERPGFTRFNLSFKPGADLSLADQYYASISSDGENVFIDGVYPEDYRYPIIRNDWNHFTFGLENLDFIGGRDGTETITLTITFLHRGQQFDRETISRPYVALRDAAMIAAQGERFQYRWSGNYIVSADKDRYEIFTGSSTDRERNEAWRDAFNRRALTIGGNKAVMRLRPPWPERHNPNYGTALGYQLPTEQIRFTFSAAESRLLCQWAQSKLKIPESQLGVYDQNTRAEVSCAKWLSR